MKRTFLITIASLMLSFASSAADNAMETLSQAATKFTSAPSISAAYTLTTDQGRTSGRVSFSGNCFNMTSPQLLTWYDGTTQWTYNIADNEVTVTEPGPDELAQLNPMVIVNNFRQNFNATSVLAPRGFFRFELKAKNSKADISLCTVTLNEQTLMPTQIQVTMRDGRKLNIVLTSVTTGKKYNIKSFQFYAPNYPGVKTVDLR